MGQADSKQEQDFLRNLDSQYEFIKHLNDARYGDGKLYQKKNDKTQMIVLKNISVPEETGFQAWKNKLTSRQNLVHPNIVELKESILAEQEQVCSTYYKVNLVFEYLPITLKDAIEQRKKTGAYYAEQEILQMLWGSINGLAKFQELKIPHQNLRVQTLSYCNGNIKISDIPLLANITSFAAVLQDYGDASQGNYLSPILTKAVYESNHLPKHNLYKSDVYTLGMIFLQVCLLQPQDDCYEYYEGKINMQQLVTNLDKARTVYTSELMDLLDEMLEQNESDRFDFLQLKAKQKQLPQQSQHANLEDQYYNMFYNNQQMEPMEVNGSIQPSYQDEGLYPLQEDQVDNIVKPVQNYQPAEPSEIDILVHNADITRNSISPMKNNSLTQHQNNKIQEFQVQPISFAQNQTQYKPLEYQMPNNYKPIELQVNLKQDSYTNTSLYKDPTPKQNKLKDAFIQTSNVFNQIQPIEPQISLQPYVSAYPQYRESVKVTDYMDKFHFSSPNDIKQFEQTHQNDFKEYVAPQQRESSRDSYQYFQQPAQYQQPQSRFASAVPNTQPLSTYVNETYSNGQRYVGEKKNGVKEGRGRLYYKEGGYYDGNWKNDKIFGQGVLYYASGRPAYDGEWVDDKFQGNGILYNDNPKVEDIDYRNLENIGNGWTKYVGQFYDDNKNGKGVLYFLNGDRFEGQFQDDNASGPGRFITIGGQIIQGNWQFNLFVG